MEDEDERVKYASDVSDQKLICSRYSVAFCEAPPSLKVGVNRNVRSGIQPLNGLRHPPEDGTTGWYIWAGETLSEDPEFFLPLHTEHLVEWCPTVVKYLGLPPGWRFQIAPEHEDVWFDSTLLSV